LQNDSSRQRVFRSRSLNFPAPSSALPVTWRTLEGFRRPRLGPLQLRSTSELLPTLRSGLPTFLSWDSLGFRYLPGIAAGSSVPDPSCAPPSMSSLASTPARALLPSLRARRFLAVHRVPTPWFRTTSPAFSAIDSRACCIPLPILGFFAFQLGHRVWIEHRSPLLEVILAGRRRAAFPRSRCSPRRISPFRSRSVSPRSLPSWRSPLSSGHLAKTPLPVKPFLASSSDLSPSRLLSAKGPCTLGAVFGRRWPVLPGLSSPSRSFDLQFGLRRILGGCSPAQRVFSSSSKLHP